MSINPSEKHNRPQHTASHQRSGASPRVRHGKRKRKLSRGARILIVILVTLAAVVGLGLIAFSLWNKAPEVSDAGLKTQTIAAPVGAGPSGVPNPTPSLGEKIPLTTLPPSAAPEGEQKVVRREGVYTLLLAGRDRVGLNTDTIMAVQLDTKAGTINVVSIPRDTLVNVPWAIKKVNSIYGTYGLEGLVDGIEDLVGIPFDSYVVINTSVFQQLVDSMGGVWFDVPIYMNYDDPDQNLHIHLSPGYQLLNGAQAEGLVRFRQSNGGGGYGKGDLERIEVQHAFLKAAAEQLLSLGNISNLPELIELVINNTDTNLTSGNIAFYAQEFFKMGSGAIRFYTMPCDNVYILDGSYVSIQMNPWLEMINSYLNPFNVEVTAYNLDLLMFNEGGFFSTTGNVLSEGSDYNITAG